MPKGLITIVRDAVMPILFGGWNAKQDQPALQNNTTGDLGFLVGRNNLGPDGTAITESNYEAQIAANRGPVHAALRVTSQKVGASTLRIFTPKMVSAKAQKSQLYVTRTRAIPELKKRELLEKAGPGSVLALADDAEEIVAGHRLVDLIVNVNSQWDIFQLQSITAGYLGLTGNCYWVLLKDNLGLPTAIWVAPAEFMRVIPDADTLVAGYVYRQGQNKRTFAVDDVIHFKSPAPGVKFQFYGRGDLMGAADDFELLKNMYAFELAIFRNGGIPATMINVQGNWTEEQKTSFRLQFLQRFGGSANAGKPMVGENVSVEQLGLSPRDMAYQEARKFSNTNIYSNFGIPEAMMTGQVSTRAALDASIAQVAIFTIDPFLRLMQQALNAQLIPQYTDPIYVEYDTVIPQDKLFVLEEQVKLLEAAVLAGNEVRKERGLEPMEGLDVPYQNISRVPVGTEIDRRPTQAQVENMAERALAEAKRRMGEWDEKV